MSGVLKNRKKREEAEAAAAAALTASANSNLMANVDELLSSQGLIPEPSDSTGKKTKGAAKKTGSGNEEDNESDSDDKKGKAKKGLAPPKSTGAAPAGAKKRKRGESENAEDEPAAKEAATGEPTNKEAEVRINSKGTIDEDGSSSEEDEGEGHSENDNGERDLTASGKPRQKKFIKRRMRRYLSLEDKIAVFERIVKEIDPKTKKLRYGASNEICADYFIGRKTINNIKNLFEGLIREGKDLSSILSAETMTDIPIKLNVDLEAATQPLTDELFNGEEAENEKARQTLLALKQQLQINHATNAASISITNEEDSDSDKEGNDLLHKLKLRVTNSAAAAAAAAASTVSADGEDGEGGKYKPLFDDETRMRKMLKVNNVGRQTKLNDLTIERIKTIVPYCFGVKELSDMYEKQFGEKIHQSTLWRYCAELNIKIPKKTNKK